MTNINMDGKPIIQLDINFLGEDFIWLRGLTEKGEKIETMYLRTTV